MATTADIRNGLVVDLEGHLMQVVYFQHVKPGKGGAFVRTKLRNVRTGAVLDRTFTSGERLTDVRLEHRPIQFSYSDGHFYHFMDLQTFDDIMLNDDLLGADQLKYLKEGLECTGLVHQDKVILVELPAGANAEAMAAWLLARRQGEAETPAPGRVVGGVAALTQSGRNYWTITVTPGNYAFLCLLADDGDGRPHLAHGHLQRFEVLEPAQLLETDSL